MKTETCKQTDKSWQRKVLGLVMGGEDGTGFGEGVGPEINQTVTFENFPSDFRYATFFCLLHSLITPPKTFKKHVI